MVELILETITPVHVGTGNKYTGAEFVLKDKTLYRVSPDNLMKKLTLEQIEDLTKQLEDHNFSLTDFLKDKKIALSEIEKYACGFDGPGTPREIAEHIKTNNQAYIPGSSIKGAIRTAITYKILKDDYSVIDNELKRIKSDGRLMGNMDRKLTQSPASKDISFSKALERAMSSIESVVLRGYKNDAKYDLLKFLQIIDSSVTKRVSVLTTKSFGMSQERRSYAQIEAIDKAVILKGELALEAIKLRELGLANKAQYLDLNYILNAIYIFTEDLKSLEKEYAEKHNLTKLVEFYTFSEFNNQPDSPILRIGANKGFLSNTINLLIKMNDPDFYRYMRFVVRRSHPNEFPKTRKIIFEGGKAKYPPGWLKLKIGENFEKAKKSLKSAPKVYKDEVARNNKSKSSVIEMKKAMIISVGGTPEPIIKSINTYSPDLVYFMPAQSSITMIGKISAKIGISPLQIKTKIVEDHQSLASAIKKASEIIKELKEDYEIWIDYTGGTKSMSAGLVAAGLNEGCKFVYFGAVDEAGSVKRPIIFLAHAKEDKEQVCNLYHKLKEAGFEPWIDEKILPGQVWKDKIQEAIKNSDFIIACLSKLSVAKKGYVQKEYRTALDLYEEKPPDDISLIPVRLDDCTVPDLEVGTTNLRDFQWVDFFKSDGFEKIRESIMFQWLKNKKELINHSGG